VKKTVRCRPKKKRAGGLGALRATKSTNHPLNAPLYGPAPAGGKKQLFVSTTLPEPPPPRQHELRSPAPPSNEPACFVFLAGPPTPAVPPHRSRTGPRLPAGPYENSVSRSPVLGPPTKRRLGNRPQLWDVPRGSAYHRFGATSGVSTSPAQFWFPAPPAFTAPPMRSRHENGSHPPGSPNRRNPRSPRPNPPDRTFFSFDVPSNRGVGLPSSQPQRAYRHGPPGQRKTLDYSTAE